MPGFVHTKARHSVKIKMNKSSAYADVRAPMKTGNPLFNKEDYLIL